MRASLLKTRTTLRNPGTATRSASNRPSYAYADVATFRANWKDEAPMSSDEGRVAGDVNVARSRSRVTFRYRSDVTARSELVRQTPAGDVTYRVVGEPQVLGNNQWTAVYVERPTPTVS